MRSRGFNLGVGSARRCGPGLAHAQGRVALRREEFATCEPALLRPTPRIGLGEALRGLATAAIDISDGLTGDLGHVLQASNAGAQIELAAIPHGAAMKRLLASGERGRARLSAEAMTRASTVPPDASWMSNALPANWDSPSRASARSGKQRALASATKAAANLQRCLTASTISRHDARQTADATIPVCASCAFSCTRLRCRAVTGGAGDFRHPGRAAAGCSAARVRERRGISRRGRRGICCRHGRRGTGRDLGVSDHGAIVWDEVVAFLLVLFLSGRLLARCSRSCSSDCSYRQTTAARFIDREWHGGFSVMTDDIVAAFTRSYSLSGSA